MFSVCGWVGKPLFCYKNCRHVLRGWIKCATHSIFIIYHTFSGHMTNIAHLRESHDQYGTFWSHVMNIAHFSSHTTNMATILLFVFIGMTPSAAFVDASGLVGDMKRLCLPCLFQWLFEHKWWAPSLRLILHKWQSPSLRLILHPLVNPPTQKLYIN